MTKHSVWSLQLEQKTSRRLSLHYSHTTQNLCKFNTSAIDSGLDRSLGYFQQIHNLVITQFFDVAKNYAGAQVRRKLVDAGLHGHTQLVALHLTLNRAA